MGVFSNYFICILCILFCIYQEFLVNAFFNVESIVKIGNYKFSQRRLWAWGSNTFGSLGLNSSSTYFLEPEPVTLPTQLNESIIHISIGYGDHVLILSSNGRLFGSGRNDWGQLGLGDFDSRSTFTSVEQENDIINHACVMKESSIYLTIEGKIKAFGRNEYGQLGVGSGSRKDGTFPAHIKPSSAYQSISMKSHNIFSIKCASQSAYAITDKGLFGWGRNDYFQLGIGNQMNYYIPTLIFNEKINNLYVGEHEAFMLTLDGKLFGWGRGWSGQLGVGEVVNHIAPRPIQFFDDTVIQNVAVGAGFIIVQTLNGSISELYAFGNNSQGQLSLGDNSEIEVTSPQNCIIEELNGKKVIYIQANSERSILTTQDGSIYWSGEINLLGSTEFNGVSSNRFMLFNTLSYFSNNITSFFGDRFAFFLESYSCGSFLDLDDSVCSNHGICTSDENFCSCSPGYSNSFDNFNEFDCQPCPPGYYWNSSDSRDSTTCIPCPIATYSEIFAAESEASCLSCDLGFITESLGSNSSSDCFYCDPGTFTEIDYILSKASCKPCPSGTYSSDSLQVSIESCKNCPAGTYSSIEGASSISYCQLCPEGTYSTTLGAVNISSCTLCPIGTFSTTKGAFSISVCQSCPLGYYSSINGSTTCERCPSGTFTYQTGTNSSDLCFLCDFGYYISDERQLSSNFCDPCPLGTFSNIEGSYICTSCPLGYITMIEGSTNDTDCIPCSKGKYTIDGEFCYSCPKGTYNELEGQGSLSSCISCPAGTWGELLGAFHIDNCTKCPAGKYSGVLGASSNSTCQYCPIGTFSLEGSTSCIACPLGSQVIVNENNITTCIPCKAGQYISTDGDGTTTCPNCPFGTYTDKDGQLMCIKCPNGYTTLIEGANSSSNCIPCEAGHYSNFVSNNGSCEPCPQGTWSSVVGAWNISTCISCEEGTYRNVSGGNSSESCSKCPAGTFSNITGAIYITTCQTCPTETYSYEGSFECTPCPPGTVTSGGGKTSEDDCLPCFVGTYSQTINNIAYCVPCSSGTYSETPFATSSETCIPCSPGKYNNLTGSDTSNACLSCPSGRYQPNYQATSFEDCLKCPLGTYSNYPASINCTWCPDGYSTVSEGKSSLGDCVKCSAGTYSNRNNSIQICVPCPEGTYSDVIGASSISTCTPCPFGTYLNTTGANSNSSCLLCPVGTFSIQSGATSNETCELCPQITYSDTPGSTTCKNCPFGTIPGPIGQISLSDCKSCPLGEYLNQFLNGSYGCVKCPAGYFSEQESAVGESACVPCPQGTYSFTTGASGLSSCLKCPLGTFSTVLAAITPSVCELCPSNTFSDQLGSTSCNTCPNGTMTCSGDSNYPICTSSIGNTDITKCIECKDGSYYEIKDGIGVCTRCPIGYYSSKTDSDLYCGYNSVNQAYGTELCTREEPHYNIGLESCIPCGFGLYFKIPTTLNWLANSKSLVCFQCPSSTYSNVSVAIGETQCQQCPASSYATQGSSLCTNCPAGTYSTKSIGERKSPDDCITCPEGTFSLKQSAQCISCPQGTWSNIKGANSSTYCTPCETGTYSNVLGATSISTCIPCSPGSYAADNASTICISCSAGSANSLSGQTSCYLCSPGFYSYQNALECLPCPPGTANNIQGATSIDFCLPCNEGSYAPFLNHTTCIDCGEDFSCPYGASARIVKSAYTNNFVRSVVDITEIVARTESLTKSGEIVKFTLIPLTIVGFILLLLVTTVIGCLRAGLKDPFKYFAIYDTLFNLYHPAPYGKPRIKKSNRLGGLFTLLTVFFCFLIFLLQTTDVFLNNIHISESFQMVEPKGANSANEIDITQGLYNVSISFFGNFEACTINSSIENYIQISSRGFLSVIDNEEPVIYCEQREKWRDIKNNEWFSISNCYCEWKCLDCILDGIAQTIDVYAPFVHTSSIFFELGVPHYLIDSTTNKRKQFKIDGNALSSSQNVFFGPKETPINLYFSIFHTKYIESPNFIESLYKNEKSVSTGVTSQLLSVSTTGSTSNNERMKMLRNQGTDVGVSIRYNLDVSKFVYISEEELTQTLITYIATLAALFGAIYSIMRVILNLTEMLKKTIKKRFKKIEQNLRSEPDAIPDPLSISKQADIQHVDEIHKEKTDPFKFLGFTFLNALGDTSSSQGNDFSSIYTTDEDTEHIKKLENNNNLQIHQIPIHTDLQDANLINEEPKMIQAWENNDPEIFNDESLDKSDKTEENLSLSLTELNKNIIVNIDENQIIDSIPSQPLFLTKNRISDNNERLSRLEKNSLNNLKIDNSNKLIDKMDINENTSPKLKQSTPNSPSVQQSIVLPSLEKSLDDLNNNLLENKSNTTEKFDPIINNLPKDPLPKVSDKPSLKIVDEIKSNKQSKKLKLKK